MKKRIVRKKVNHELLLIFDKSPLARVSVKKFETVEQKFIIENDYGRLNCEYDPQAAARQIDWMLFSQFLERNWRKIEVLERRHAGNYSSLRNDEELKALLNLSNNERKKYVPVAMEYLAANIRSSLINSTSAES